MDERKRFGDLEGDLIMGKGHKSALLVTTDRATLKTTINYLKGKDPKDVTRNIIRRARKMPQIKTITFDNDQAFSMHEIIAKKLNAKVYFTRPYKRIMGLLKTGMELFVKKQILMKFLKQKLNV